MLAQSIWGVKWLYALVVGRGRLMLVRTALTIGAVALEVSLALGTLRVESKAIFTL